MNALERSLIVALGLTLVAVLAGVLLGMVGFFHWWTVGPVVAASMPMIARRSPNPKAPLDRWGKVACLVVALVVTGNSLFPAEHLITGRDAATYVATGIWLARDAGFDVEAADNEFGDYDVLEYRVAGFYERTRGVLEPQFMHGYPVLFGIAVDAFGLSSALRLNAVLGGFGLLLVFALARRLMRGWVAVLVVGTLATSLVFLYYSRAPFSELLMLVFVVGGVWTLAMAISRGDPWLGGLAGACLGAATVARVDGVVLLIPALAYFGFARTDVGPSDRSVLRAARAGLLVVAAFGVVESLTVAPAYILDRSSVVAPVLVAVLVVMLVVDLHHRGVLRQIEALLRRHKVIVVNIGIGVTGAVLIYAWFVRPHVSPTFGDAYDLDAIRRSEGLPMDDRTYLENSVQWIAWYQGALFVVSAFVGWALIVRTWGRSAIDTAGKVVAMVLAVFAGLYLWRPSINPDQIWVMRRYLTVVMPFGAFCAGAAVEAGLTWATKASEKVRVSVIALLAAALVASPIVVSAPLWNLRELQGLQADFLTLCEGLDEGDRVLFMSGSGESDLSFVQNVRGICGASVAWNGHELTPGELERLRIDVEGHGASLRIVEAGGSGPGSELHFASEYPFLELTLTRPPQDTLSFRRPIAVSGP